MQCLKISFHQRMYFPFLSVRMGKQVNKGCCRLSSCPSCNCHLSNQLEFNPKEYSFLSVRPNTADDFLPMSQLAFLVQCWKTGEKSRSWSRLESPFCKMTLAVRLGPIYRSAENADSFVVRKEKNQLTHQCFVDFTTLEGTSKYMKWRGRVIECWEWY